MKHIKTVYHNIMHLELLTLDVVSLHNYYYYHWCDKKVYMYRKNTISLLHINLYQTLCEDFHFPAKFIAVLKQTLILIQH